MNKVDVSHKIFKAVSSAGKKLNYPVYVVGGYVRDQLLGRKKEHKDIDFVCVGSGIQFAKETARLLNPTIKVSVFKTYGTAMFKYQGIDYEFVGARKESYRKDSRNPIVEKGTLEDDQNRRDFTINALAVSLNESSFGEMIDSFGGLIDLENKIIKTPLEPNITFSDDPLRMLRAIRFATQLKFRIEEKTFTAIGENAERIKIISQERISTEINKIIQAEKPSIGFKLLEKTGLLALIFPELVNLKGVEIRNGVGHKDNFYHTLEVLDNLAENSNDLWLRWSAILHDIAKPKTKRFEEKAGWTFHGHEVVGARMVKPIFKKFKLSLGAEMRFVQKMVRLHLRPIPLSKDEISDSAIRRLIFDAGEDVEKLMLLCEADITSKNEAKVKRYLHNFQLVRQKMVEIEEKDHIRNFQPPVSGEKIMQTFGLKPCREVGLIKDRIKEAILEGEIQNNITEAENLMYDIAKEMGLKTM